MSQYLDKDGASRIAENFLSKQAEQDAILRNLQFDLKEAEHALVKTIQGPAPLNIRALTRPLDNYVISGNTVQNGTPTPDAPVDVVGCGVRTGNLVEFSNGTTTVLTVDVNVEKQKVTFSGTSSGSGGRLVRISNYIALDPGVYILSILGSGACPSTILQNYFDSSEFYSVGRAFTLESKKIFFISFNFVANREYNGTLSIMLNAGSTPLPYEPYGYKLPPTVNGTEYPIYLGQVETTRRIRKLVLKGDDTETYISSYSGDNRFFTYLLGSSGYDVIISTHFTRADISSKSTNVGVRIINPADLRIRPENVRGMTVDGFKAWLSAQYANGTPVTVWYVLATPETGIVNEPLHKIGDYADTISMAQAGAEITTTKGFNTITTNTTVLPSNIEVKGVINNA